MRKLFILLMLTAVSAGSRPAADAPVRQSDKETMTADPCLSLYRKLSLQNDVAYDAFLRAYTGYREIGSRGKDVLVLIDFTKPSTEQRMFIIDMEREVELCRSLVAHGKNSGEKYARSFSNRVGSLQSSLGFYLTDNTYQGKNGYSLLLNGLEKGINDKARERAVVVHGAAYANPSVIASSGRLGRSFGCPAVPEADSRRIIDLIKGGAVMFIYADNPDYERESVFMASLNETGDASGALAG